MQKNVNVLVLVVKYYYSFLWVKYFQNALLLYNMVLCMFFDLSYLNSDYGLLNCLMNCNFVLLLYKIMVVYVGIIFLLYLY